MADRCLGCRLHINDQPHIHVGAQLREGENRVYTVQDPSDPAPSVAIVLREGDKRGDVSLIAPEGIPHEVMMPVVGMIRDQFGGKALNPQMMREMLLAAENALSEAARIGAIRRDYQGNWHCAGVA